MHVVFVVLTLCVLCVCLFSTLCCNLCRCFFHASIVPSAVCVLKKRIMASYKRKHLLLLVVLKYVLNQNHVQVRTKEAKEEEEEEEEEIQELVLIV